MLNMYTRSFCVFVCAQSMSQHQKNFLLFLRRKKCFYDGFILDLSGAKNGSKSSFSHLIFPSSDPEESKNWAAFVAQLAEWLLPKSAVSSSNLLIIKYRGILIIQLKD